MSLRTLHFSCAVLLAIALTAGCRKKKAAPPPPPEVQVVTIAATNVPIYEEWIGTLDGFVNAQIRAQVSGYLLAQNYAEGNQVKKGALLFEIDPRPFQAVLDQAKARLAQDEAQLERTRLDVARYTPLAEKQAISRETLDNAVQAHRAAQAQVKADQAAVETALLNLSFTKIASPVDGLAGLAQAQIGDLVGPSGGVLTTVSTIDPVKVYFQVSEQSYLTFWRHFIGANGSWNEAPGLDLQLILSDGSAYGRKGKFFFADRQVNISTGTLQITGLFPNEHLILRPGQYGRVRARTQIKRDTLLVPQRALTELQGSYQVAVIGETNQIRIQTVQVGLQIGTDWIIEKGLKAGDRVVVEGTQKAKHGTVVTPKPLVAQTNNPAR